ncbi:caspase family protein [Mesorhizobium sp. B263B2A]|uniref:caspase family protein n=1 Tax=Mesorhizobium sp. B263B2A TaxID=2876669 RepID=UPI001CD13B31|nr:caspase family protein [Mesorhizobium sp. B263B2A]MCA0032654.1 caspase family protein [Mesorhizobium sp. B263B2A]
MGRTVYAVLVGIDDYPAPVPGLRGCVNDIDAIAALLQNFGQTGAFAIDAQLLKNDQATRSNVISGFRDHLGKAGPDDVALFYFSGHGSQENAPVEFWNIEPDHLNETLVCFDSRSSGNWDLADKELAVLIAEIAGRAPHFLCVLDCCHSGSGTRAALEEGLAIRRAPTDRRERPIAAFLNGSLLTKAGNDKATSDTNWVVMPEGRHVLLAACRSSETAKEVNDDGRPHGAFTAALLAALRQTRGSISYRDLMKRAEAQLRMRVAQQVPQIESSDPQDLQLFFLDGAVHQGRATFTMSFDGGLQWIIDGGAIHGIAPPQGSQTTSFAIFPLDADPTAWRSLDAAVALADVHDVRPELSCVDIRPSGHGDLDRNLTYRAILVATPLPAKLVYLSGEESALQLVREALGRAGDAGSASLLVQEARTEDTANFRVLATTAGYQISRSSADRPLVAEIEGANADGAALVVERLEHVARWQAVSSLSNLDSHLGEAPVTISMRLPVADGRANAWNEVDPRAESRLYYTRSANGKWRAPRLRLTLTNSSDFDLYCALLWLGEDYSVSSNLFPTGAQLVPSGESLAVAGGRDLCMTIPDAKWQTGRTELTDQLKLIVSREQFDATLFNQGAIETYTRTRSLNREFERPRSMLERLAKRVYYRDISAQPDGDEKLGDWATSDMALTVVRPLEAAQVPQAGEQVELGSGVMLLGHPAFEAQVSLVSTTEVGRSLGALGTPAIFRDDPVTSQPFLFETARGTDPGLGALQLSGIENAASVTTEAPLRFRVATSLAPGEHVLPYAWDGEFYLPLGIGRPVDGALEIELRQIPVFSTAADVERGIVSSLRILFQKIVSPYLAVGYDYPHLAAVSFNAKDQPVYETDVTLARGKVGQAQRILLYVHGILGDTLGMTAASKAKVAMPGLVSKRIADDYDLVLAFDYENINTSIKDNARSMKSRLEAVGLGVDHGKMLHVAAHSMGGLVTRWFIEKEGGNRVVQHLVMLGTPNGGSPWPTIQNWANAALAIGLNGLSSVAWPLQLLGDLAAAAERVDVALDEMAPGSPFLTELGQSDDPRTPYSLLIGNTSIIPAAVANGTLRSLLERLSPQHVLHDVTALAFLNKPNDIAVAVASARALPEPRNPALLAFEVACDHLTFFTTEAGRAALMQALLPR